MIHSHLGHEEAHIVKTVGSLTGTMSVHEIREGVSHTVRR